MRFPLAYCYLYRLTNQSSLTHVRLVTRASSLPKDAENGDSFTALGGYLFAPLGRFKGAHSTYNHRVPTVSSNLRAGNCLTTGKEKRAALAFSLSLPLISDQSTDRRIGWPTPSTKRRASKWERPRSSARVLTCPHRYRRLFSNTPSFPASARCIRLIQSAAPVFAQRTQPASTQVSGRNRTYNK